MSPDRWAHCLVGASFPAPPRPSLGLAKATCHIAMPSCPAALPQGPGQPCASLACDLNTLKGRRSKWQRRDKPRGLFPSTDGAGFPTSSYCRGSSFPGVAVLQGSPSGPHSLLSPPPRPNSVALQCLHHPGPVASTSSGATVLKEVNTRAGSHTGPPARPWVEAGTAHYLHAETQ